MSLKTKIRAAPYWAYASLFGKVPFKDRYGLKYYLWKDTRLADTVIKKVRTDDTGLLHQLFIILDTLKQQKPELTCVDVGAFIGVISMAMATKAGDRGRVFAFEPNPKNRFRVTQNAQHNRLDNISILPFGIADSRAKNVKFQIMASPGEGFVLDAIDDDIPITSKTSRTITIDLETLENFAADQGIQTIDVLKVDAEGVDDKALKGAGHMLATGNILFVFCEYNPSAKAGQRCIQLLRESNYDIFYIVRNDVYMVQSMDHYPHSSHKAPLNLLAIAPNAPVFSNGTGLDIRR